MRTIATSCFAAALALFAATAAHAEDEASFELIIKDHKFQPARLEVPANKKVTLVVKNQDSTPEEFESKELKREKVIAPGKQVPVMVGPLKPGEYKFFGEYHEDTAQGVLVAK
jgi:plastocyanin